CITSSSIWHHLLQISGSPFPTLSSSQAWFSCSPAADLNEPVSRWDSMPPLRHSASWEQAGIFLLLRPFCYRERLTSPQLPSSPRYRIPSGTYYSCWLLS